MTTTNIGDDKSHRQEILQHHIICFRMKKGHHGDLIGSNKKFMSKRTRGV